jgi:exosortase
MFEAVFPAVLARLSGCCSVKVFAKVRSVLKEGFDSGMWRRAVAPMTLAIAWGALYFDTLRRLVDDWRVDENYSHGFLIPFISAYAIWRNRDRIISTPVAPRIFLGGALMLMAVLMLFAGVVGAELYLARLSLVLSLAALALYFLGLKWLKLLVFPIGLLLFALPIPSIVFNQIAFPLQLIASDYATRAIRLFGIPALREGNVIELAQMKLQVVEACSGIRSLVTLATLAVVYGYFTEKRLWRRIALFVAVIPIAIIANAARVAGTGLMAHHWGIQAAEGFLHGFSGWLVFFVAVLLLLAFAQALSWIERMSGMRYGERERPGAS